MTEIIQKIQYVEVSRLKLHEDNPRIIKDDQFKNLCQSLKDNPRFFETRPILCNKEMVVFAGNMRLRAALEIGMKEVPVSIMDVSEEKQRELLVRDNVQNGEWQVDALANEYDAGELSSFGMDVAKMGIFDDEKKDTSTDPDHSGCARCAELKAAVQGHENRSGHKV